MRTAFGLPEIMPERAAGARIHGPRVVGRREVEYSVDFQNRAGNARSCGSAGSRIGAFTPNDSSAPAPPSATAPAATKASDNGTTARRPGRHRAHPGQRQVLDVRLVN